ncbi:MAG: lysine--tRNA ligase [Bradymonadales bacterium]|nr:MAG: lysine--tRNA ligase [Bradymonadales bacterium]
MAQSSVPKTEGSGQQAQLEARKKKMQEWLSQGQAPFPTAESCQPRNLASELQAQYQDETKESLEQKKAAGELPTLAVAGRVMLHRSFGKSSFLTLQDRSGRIQAFAQKTQLPEPVYEMIKHMDLGDLVFVEGLPFRTKTGELTIEASRFQLLTKSLRPLPEKFHGLQDIEQRYRQRYLDLMTNETSVAVFRKRSQIVQEIRSFFSERDYLEVETPMLHPLVSGAAARPFETFHHTLKMKLFLRIAPELYLKRLVVGGLHRVFELNRCFRNEGISIKHNPEFSMLEFYEAFATYEDLMKLTEDLIERLALKICATKDIEYQGEKISLAKPFRRLSVQDAIREFAKIDPLDSQKLENALRARKIELKNKPSLASLQWTVFEEMVEDQLIQPTFVVDHPIEISPLARRSETRPEVAERFELYIAGREIANGFNELNDPEDQRLRFEDQLKRKAEGDQEATDFDEDYLEALEYGLPPTAGEGIGIDRLTMLLTNSASIRDVILFPQMRSLHEERD